MRHFFDSAEYCSVRILTTASSQKQSKLKINDMQFSVSSFLFIEDHFFAEHALIGHFRRFLNITIAEPYSFSLSPIEKLDEIKLTFIP